MRDLEAMEQAVAATPDRQISLTDPDARAMASTGTGTGLVGYNLQAAVDADTHIVVAHEVINLSHDGTSLASMGRQARETTGVETVTVLADRGYFSGPEVLACDEAGIMASAPSRSPPERRLRGASASRTSSTSPAPTPTAFPPARR
jgi:hypothetical protein